MSTIVILGSVLTPRPISETPIYGEGLGCGIWGLGFGNQGFDRSIPL